MPHIPRPSLIRLVEGKAASDQVPEVRPKATGGDREAMGVINALWAAMLILALVTGAATGREQQVVNALFSGASLGAKIALDLLGVMAFWLGLTQVAEKAGVLRILTRGLRPLVRWLFPQVPAGHPAEGAILLNFTANLLGLGNAATPFGLLAMRHLQDLNPEPSRASPAMITFLAINTAGITLVPALIMAVRAQAGAADPGGILVPCLLATVSAAAAALAADRLWQKLAGGRPVGHPAGSRPPKPPAPPPQIPPGPAAPGGRGEVHP